VCYSLDFGRVLYLLCVIPSILAVFCFCCVLYLLFCCGLFPQFCLCAIYLLWAIPSILLCAIFVVCYSVSVLARACTRARLCAVFALCYALNFDCVLFLLYAMPSILAVCYICCVLFPQFWLCMCYICCVLFPQFWLCMCYICCVLFPQFWLCVCYICCVLFPQFWLCAIFAVFCSLNFGCVLYLLCAIPSISAVCGCFCCGLFPQFWLYAIFAILRTPYILYYLRRVSRVCLPGGVQLVVVSLALRKCVRKKSHPNLNSLLPGIGE
jgi:hypothetical protein